VLLVEGWLSGSEMRDASNLIRAGKYEVIYTTGGPCDDEGDKIDASNTFAWEAAKRLHILGIPEAQIQPAPCLVWQHDRTYSSAVALREWLKSQGRDVTAINVATEGTHARRTQIMFQLAFGDSVAVGVIPIKNHFYDPDHWWRYSEGVKAVISEGAGYLYTKLLFKADG
jgi:hypothetical protein